MSFESEMKARFGGFWNSFLLLLVVIVCLRFSSIEFAGEDLVTRLTCSLHLIFICIGAGIFMAIVKLILAFSNEPYARFPKATSFAFGLKYGIITAGVLIFIIGLIQLDNFLGPFQPLVDAFFAKLQHLIS